LEFKEIKQIVELMNKHELSYFHLEKDDFCLELKKGADLDAMREILASAPPSGALPAAAPPMSPPATGTAVAPTSSEEGDEGGVVVKAPMVGTFYRAPAEGADPFVKVGQEVSEDTTLCLIEAMKTFNEIKAEQSGVIVKICVDNAHPVQYEDPLFVIKPS